jgi:GNAT superfamily N-acetyltransferase
MQAKRTYLPGRLEMGAGDVADYAALARFHYVAKRPATFACIVTARFVPGAWAGGGRRPRVVGVGVLSWPTVHARGREVKLDLGGLSLREKLTIVNRDVRTISRVIVHPQFRGIGLAVELVRRLIAQCPTRYVEALARMGRAHPLFERAGMERVAMPGDGPVYYIFDRHLMERSNAPSQNARRC